MSCSEHEKCYHAEIIQQDISTNNIIISNGVGHLIDFDHSKVIQQFKWLLGKFEELVISRAEEMMNNSDDAQEYLISLLKCNVCTRSLLWDALDINNFILFYFLILLYFFLFLLFYFEG